MCSCGSQPVAVDLLLHFRLARQRHDAERSFTTWTKLDQQRAQLVETKDREVDQISRLLLSEPRIEKVSGHAQVVDRNDLVAEIQSLLVRRRARVHAFHHQSIVSLLEIGAKEDSIARTAATARRNYFQSQAGGFQSSVVIELCFPAHVFAEELLETAARHQLCRLLKIGWSIVAIFLVVLGVEITHHVVERLRAGAALANLQVKQQAEQSAFLIIRDLRVHRVLILPVILDPRIEARLFRTLLQTPWRILQRLHRTRSRTQIFSLADQSRTTQSHVRVVIRDAFRNPEHLRVVFLRVIKRPERVGANSLHVPKMEKLVRHQRKKAAIFAIGLAGSIWRRRGRALATRGAKTKTRIAKRGGVQMLESAAATQVQNERVDVIRNLTHQLGFRLDDLLHVAAHAFRIVVPFSVDHDPVRDAFNSEDERLEVADFDPRVVEDR